MVSNDPFSFDFDDIPLHGKPECTGSIFNVSEKALSEVIGNAEAGDAKASFRLYHYYLFSIGNLEEAEAWLLKAAEQGSSVAQYNMAIRFFQKNDYDKALVWAEMAKASGSDSAESLINQITGNINSSL